MVYTKGADPTARLAEIQQQWQMDESNHYVGRAYHHEDIGLVLTALRAAQDHQEAERNVREDLGRRLVAAEAEVSRLTAALATAQQADRCGAERCLCGHFHCVHNDVEYRGQFTCASCDCKGFAPSEGREP